MTQLREKNDRLYNLRESHVVFIFAHALFILRNFKELNKF